MLCRTFIISNRMFRIFLRKFLRLWPILLILRMIVALCMIVKTLVEI